MLKYFKFVFLLSLFAFKSEAQNQRNGYASVLHQPPDVDFSWLNACLGDTTQFINGSIRANTYTWTVYNKSMNKLDSSNALNMKYYFPVKDTFYVELVADNGHFTSSLQTVIIDTVTTAAFNFMHCSNQFMNHATCATSFLWDFGDGNTSTVSLPTHQYADTGYYTIKFIAYKGIYSDTITKQIFVNPQAFPTGAITWYLSNDTIFVHAIDSMAGMFYNWNFGGGVHLYKRDTFFVYANPGTYYLNFSDWNTCNTAYALDTVVYAVNGINTAPGKYNLSLSVFPNPAFTNEEVTVSVKSAESEKINLSMYTIYGQKILEKDYNLSTGENILKLKIDNAAAGIYFLFVQSVALKTKAKIILQNKK